MSIYPQNFLVRKAYELNYAFFRVAESSRESHSALAERLEARALDLFDAILGERFFEAQGALLALHYLLRIGSDSGALNPSHANTILKEVEIFNAAIGDKMNAAKEENPASIFSNWDGNSAKTNLSLPELKIEAKQSGNEIRQNQRMEAGGVEDSGQNRLSSVLSRIRQNGNCRVKDLQEFLSDVSERTIRYDLQKLLDRGLVERVGNGGPATFYRASERTFPS